MSLPTNRYARYHAHVYFDQDSVDFASELCVLAGKTFDLKVGRVHRKLVGPHPCWSCQLAFDSVVFDQLIPWLDERRGDLNVLVHGLTEDALADHTDHAAWLGRPQPLKLDIFAPKTEPGG